MRGGVLHLRRNAIAYVALVLAAGGGVAWAGSKIGGGEIKANAIKARHVDDNALTGDDVKESALDLEQPKAFNWIGTSPTPETVVTKGELTLTASCATSGAIPPGHTLELSAQSSGGRIEMSGVFQAGASAPYVETEFGPTADPKVLGTFTNPTSGVTSGGGTIVFHPTTEVVTVTFRIQVDEDDCRVAGTAVHDDL